MGKSTRFAIEHASTTRRTPPDQDRQSEQFIKAARELGCDESEEHFNEALKTVAKHKPKDEGSAKKDVLAERRNREDERK